MGLPFERELAIDLIFQSFPKSFSHFFMNLLMNDMEKTLSQLAPMLRTAENNMKGKGKAILMVNNGKGKVVANPPTKALKPT